MGALNGTHATIQDFKLSMESTQQVVPSLEADLTSIQNLEQRKRRRRQEGRVKPYDQVAKLTLNSKAVLQEMKAEPRQNKHRAYLGKT